MTIDTSSARELLIREIHLDGFTEAEQNEIISFLEENIVIKLNNDIFDALNEEDRSTFIMLSEVKGNKHIGEFLKEKIPNIEELIYAAARYIIQDFKQRQTR